MLTFSNVFLYVEAEGMKSEKIKNFIGSLYSDDGNGGFSSE